MFFRPYLNVRALAVVASIVAMAQPPLAAGPSCPGGTDAECDDGIPCTTDICFVTFLTCIHEDRCVNGVFCDGVESCCTEPGGCDAVAFGGCVPGAPESCPPGEFCHSQLDLCVECDPTAPTGCDDANDCTDDACNEDGTCSNTPQSGGACDDGNLCTTSDVCDLGQCAGVPADCQAQASPCQTGTCDDLTGQCVFESLTDTTPCEDGDPCTATSQCQDGVCVNDVVPGAVDLEFRLPSGLKTVSVGAIIDVDVWAFRNGSQPAPPSSFCAAGEHAIAGMELAFSWDAAVFELADPGTIGEANPDDPCDDFDPCNVDCGLAGRYNWSSSVFPNDCNIDGLNQPCPGFPANDGSGLYLAFKQFSCDGGSAPPACVSSDGLWVTTLKFRAVGATVGALPPSAIVLEACLLQTRTKVADAGAPGTDTRGALHQPAAIDVECVAHDDCPSSHICLDAGCVACPAVQPPEPVRMFDVFGNSVVGTTNRFLSFTAGTTGQREALRVTFVDLPSRFDAWTGTELWVAQPRDMCELSGIANPLDPSCTSTLRVATLSCNQEQAALVDLGELGTLNLFHAGIVPGGTYTIEAVAEDFVGFEACYSEPVVMATADWGDLAGAFDEGLGGWIAPDRSIDISVDVIAAIDKFANRPGAPLEARADMEPCIVDFKIQIIDVTRILDAFRGLPFPFAPGDPIAPCPSDPCGGASQ